MKNEKFNKIEKNISNLENVLYNSNNEKNIELKKVPNSSKYNNVLENESNRNQFDMYFSNSNLNSYHKSNPIHFTNEECTNFFSDTKKIFDLFPNDDIMKKNKNYSAKNKLSVNSSKNISSLIVSNFQKPIVMLHNNNIKNSKELSQRLNEISSKNIPKIRNPYSRESNMKLNNTKNSSNSKNKKKMEKIQIYSINYNENRDNNIRDPYFDLQNKFTSLKEMPFINPMLYIGNMIAKK